MLFPVHCCFWHNSESCSTCTTWTTYYFKKQAPLFSNREMHLLQGNTERNVNFVTKMLLSTARCPVLCNCFLTRVLLPSRSIVGCEMGMLRVDNRCTFLQVMLRSSNECVLFKTNSHSCQLKCSSRREIYDFFQNIMKGMLLPSKHCYTKFGESHMYCNGILQDTVQYIYIYSPLRKCVLPGKQKAPDSSLF